LRIGSIESLKNEPVQKNTSYCLKEMRSCSKMTFQEIWQ